MEYETRTSQALKGHKIHHNLSTTTRYLLRFHSQNIQATIKRVLLAGSVVENTGCDLCVIGSEGKCHRVSANNQSLISVAIHNLNFHKKLSTFGYSKTNETVYFIEITGITDATGECKQNLNSQEKLNMRSLESRHTSSTLDQNLWIAYLDSLLKT